MIIILEPTNSQYLKKLCDFITIGYSCTNGIVNTKHTRTKKAQRCETEIDWESAEITLIKTITLLVIATSSPENERRAIEQRLFISTNVTESNNTNVTTTPMKMETIWTHSQHTE